MLGVIACYLYKIPVNPLPAALNNVWFILFNESVITEVWRKPRQLVAIVLIAAK